MTVLVAALGMGGTAAAQVKTAAGVVQAYGRLPTAPCRVFRGIPYAAPPVGEFRWQRAAPRCAVGGRP